MEKRSCFREFSRYTILSILGTLGVSCYILADTFFVSVGLGAKGLAALNLAIPVYNFIHGMGLMLGMGGAARFSVSKSQNKQGQVDSIYSNTVRLAVIFSTLFFVLGLFFAGNLATVLGADHQIYDMTTVYIKWLLIFAPAFIFNDVFLCFVRNDGSPQLSMTAMLIGSFSNILLDYIFIFPLKMGLFGAVFATGLSTIISMAFMSPHWLKQKNTFHMVKEKFRGNMAKKTIALGLPSLIAQVSSGVVMIVFNMLILNLEGNVGVAAYGVVANISLVVLGIYTGIAQGVQPLLSDFYGRNERTGIHKVLRYAMWTMLIFSLVIYGLLFVFAQPVTSVFNSEHNQELQNIAVTGLKIYFLSNVFVGYNTILATYFISVEKAVPAQVLSVLRGFLLMIPVVFISSYLWKMTGVWAAYPLTEMLASVIGYILYRRYNKT